MHPSQHFEISKDVYNVGLIRSRSKKLYSHEENCRFFISMDIQHAAFTVLYHFDSRIFNGIPSWPDYLRSQFPEIPQYFCEARRIRDLILGQLGT